MVIIGDGKLLEKADDAKVAKMLEKRKMRQVCIRACMGTCLMFIKRGKKGCDGIT